MKFCEKDFMEPCGCRSSGEYNHNLLSSQKALYAMVDEFARQMKDKLFKKFLEGKSGWDDPSWTEEQIMEALKEHVRKDNRDMVDVANLAMFLWNRIHVPADE